jgi:hypothetical protein
MPIVPCFYSSIRIFLNEQLYEQRQRQWCRELELDFVKNLVESASYR